MTEHPAWPWTVFVLNTLLIFIAVASMAWLAVQQNVLIYEINSVDQKLAKAIEINQRNIDTVAKKTGVPNNEIVQPAIPVISNEQYPN